MIKWSERSTPGGHINERKVVYRIIEGNRSCHGTGQSRTGKKEGEDVPMSREDRRQTLKPSHRTSNGWYDVNLRTSLVECWMVSEPSRRKAALPVQHIPVGRIQEKPVALWHFNPLEWSHRRIVVASFSRPGIIWETWLIQWIQLIMVHYRYWKAMLEAGGWRRWALFTALIKLIMCLIKLKICRTAVYKGRLALTFLSRVIHFPRAPHRYRYRYRRYGRNVGTTGTTTAVSPLILETAYRYSSIGNSDR